MLTIGHLSTAYHTNFILMANTDLEINLAHKINWIFFGTGPLMVDAFRQGKLDIGYMGLPPAIIGIDKGVPIKCVAGGHVEGTIMVARKNFMNISNFNNDIGKVLAQFKGKSIGVPSKGSIHDVILNHYLKKYNLVNDIQVKHYKQAEFIALDMKKGILEGGVGTPALAVFTSTLLDSHIILPPEILWKNNPSYGIFCHRDLIDTEPQIIHDFLINHKEASYLLRNSPSLAAEMIANTFKIIKKDYAQAILEISPKYCIALSEGYIKATMQFVNTLHELGYINKNLTVEDLFSFNFIKTIHPETDHY